MLEEESVERRKGEESEEGGKGEEGEGEHFNLVTAVD